MTPDSRIPLMRDESSEVVYESLTDQRVVRM